MKILYNKIITFAFVGFISLTFILSPIFGLYDMRTSMSKNKDEILNFNFSSEYFKTFNKSVEEAYTSGIFMRANYVDIFGGLQRLTGKSIMWDSDPSKTLVIGSDGKIYSAGNVTLNFSDFNVDEELLNTYAERMSDFGKFATEKGAEVVFFQAPARYDPDFVDLPIEVDDKDKQNADYLYFLLKNDSNLQILNSQKLYKEQNIAFDNLFFKTDHHWNIKTAFWGYGEICKALNKKGFNIDQTYYDINNYNINTFKNKFLGSLGVRTGGWFVGYDDFDVIYPKFETDYVKIESKNKKKGIKYGAITHEGDFEEAILEGYDLVKENKSSLAYGIYVCSDRSEVIINNRKSATDKKILIIKDSFGLPVSAFLSVCFKEERILDLRHYTEKSLSEYVEDYKPDAVVFVYNPGAYYDTFFTFD